LLKDEVDGQNRYRWRPIIVANSIPEQCGIKIPKPRITPMARMGMALSIRAIRAIRGFFEAQSRLNAIDGGGGIWAAVLDHAEGVASLSARAAIELVHQCPH